MFRNHHDKWIYQKMGLKHLSMGPFIDTVVISNLVKWIVVTPQEKDAEQVQFITT